jgi:hypothetical protein
MQIAVFVKIKKRFKLQCRVKFFLGIFYARG